MLSDTEFDALNSTYPCWWVKQDLENCNPAEKPESPTGLVLYVERNGGNPDVGTHVIAHCVATEPRCGDNSLDAGEDCDDGNNYDGDSCPADCTF
jgi:cysteine-rich repeat protein